MPTAAHTTLATGEVRRSLWRNLLVTLLFNTLAGVFFALSSDSPTWRVMLTIQVIGFSVFAAITFTFSVIKPAPAREPWYFAAAVFIGALVGLAFNWLARVDELANVISQYPHYLAFSLFFFLLAAGVIGSILWGREKTSRMESAYHLEQAKRAEQDKLLIQSQLRMLQAQIEPHFLFNTLASVQSLIDIAPDRAKQMLGLFNDYLRASLARTRNEHNTVRQELDLLQAYLGILKIRMGERLEFSLSCPEPLLDAHLPPMLLQPLVENAVSHGLEPKVEGGTVQVTLDVNGGRLVASVIDNGLGLPEEVRGQGVGLSNVRARLATLYGSAAGLSLQSNPAGGVTAQLELPLNHG